MTWAALALLVAALFLSSFATAVWQLIILQGVLYGIGAGATYAPVMLWLCEWWSARRGLACGLILCVGIYLRRADLSRSAGNGAAGFALPCVRWIALR